VFDVQFVILICGSAIFVFFLLLLLICIEFFLFFFLSVQRKNRPHFVDFLFHRNLKEKNLFLQLLKAFQQGYGYDDNFFTLFLSEAIEKDAPRIAVEVINSILFYENGEPSVEALKFCPKIPVIILEAMIQGRSSSSSSSSNHAAVASRGSSDDLRLLLEIAMRFEYYILRTELSYIRTVSRQFRDIPGRKNDLLALMESTTFINYAINVCNHNLVNVRLGAGAATPIVPTGNQRGVAGGAAGASGGAMPSAPGEEYYDESGVLIASDYDEDSIVTVTASLDVSASSSAGTGYAVTAVAVGAVAPSAATAAARARPDVATVSGSTSNGGGSGAGGTIPSFQRRTSLLTGAAASSMSGGSLGAGRITGPQDMNYSKWLVRTESNLTALIYGFITLVARCGPQPAVTTLPQNGGAIVENLILTRFLKAQHPTFYSVLLFPNTSFRARIIDFLTEQFGIVSLYQNLLGTCAVFMCCLFVFRHLQNYQLYVLICLVFPNCIVVTVRCR
jgi:hypothetical protein